MKPYRQVTAPRRVQRGARRSRCTRTSGVGGGRVEQFPRRKEAGTGAHFLRSLLPLQRCWSLSCYHCQYHVVFFFFGNQPISEQRKHQAEVAVHKQGFGSRPVTHRRRRQAGVSTFFVLATLFLGRLGTKEEVGRIMLCNGV